jgi:hypothetical protein
VGIAVLNGYDLRWHKRSKDGSGKCNALPSEGSVVFGVVYEFVRTEKKALNDAEGVGYGYIDKQIEVVLNATNTLVYSYLADPLYIDDSLRPYIWYKDFVLSGAREHGLPQAYIEILSAQNAIEDRNAAREKEERGKVL